MKNLCYSLIIAILASLFLFASCKNDDYVEDEVEVPEEIIDDTPKQVSFAVISQNEFHAGIGNKLLDVNLVVSSNDAWTDLKNKMGLTDDDFLGLSEEEIDFSKHQIIAVFDKTHGSGRWSIDITEITEYLDKIVVSVSNLKTGEKVPEISSPYQIVKIPGSEKPVEFEMKLIGSQAGNNTPKQVPFTVLFQDEFHEGAWSGYTDRNDVTSYISVWNNLKKRMFLPDSVGMNVDFSRSQIIAVLDKPHSTGGWSIDVTEIMEYADKIVVSVSNLKTGDMSSKITSPYQIIQIPRLEKPVQFKMELQDNQDNPEISRQLSFTIISQDEYHRGAVDDLCGENFVIRSERHWNEVKNKIHSSHFSEEDIDFSNYTLIAVFDKAHNGGGWSIDITKVAEFPDKIVVSGSNLKTGNSMSSTISTPYQIVKIPNSIRQKFVEFDLKLHDDQNRGEPLGSIPFTVFSEMSNRRFEANGLVSLNLVITNNDAWNDLKNKMSGYENNFPEEDIDFSKFQLIAIFDKERQYSIGHHVCVAEVVEYQDVIVISASNSTSYGSLAAIIQSVYPYQIIKIPRSEKKIEFNINYSRWVY